MPPKKAAPKDTGSWWRTPELEVLLSLVKELKPCGAYEWDKVVAQYNSKRPQGSAERTADSCKNKFKGLKNSPKPTGTADCPWEIKEAKAIQREIESRMATMDSDAFLQADNGGQVDDDGSGGGDDNADEEEDDGDGGDGAAKRAPASSPKSSSPKTANAVAAALPARLGASGAVVANAATMKRQKLDKQLEESQQRSEKSSQERTQLIALLLQQSQQQAAQQQQMNTMMMAMMSRFFPGAPFPPQ